MSDKRLILGLNLVVGGGTRHSENGMVQEWTFTVSTLLLTTRLHLVRGVDRVLGAHNVDGVVLVWTNPGVDINDVVSVGDLESEYNTITLGFFILLNHIGFVEFQCRSGNF